LVWLSLVAGDILLSLSCHCRRVLSLFSHHRYTPVICMAYHPCGFVLGHQRDASQRASEREYYPRHTNTLSYLAFVAVLAPWRILLVLWLWSRVAVGGTEVEE
jgi:hypothetical protein